MSIEDRGRLGRIGLATVMTGLMMSTIGISTTEGSLIKPKAGQTPVYYATTGTIGTPDGPPVEFLDFVGIGSPSPSPAPGGVFYTPGAFSLGGFRTSGLPTGQSRTFDALPFSIVVSLFDNPYSGIANAFITIEGVIDGELSSEPGAGLLASITSISNVDQMSGVVPFRLQDFEVLAPQFILPAGPLPTVTTPIYGYVNQVPEPTALATLGVGVAALAVHRHRRIRTRSRVGVTA